MVSKQKNDGIPKVYWVQMSLLRIKDGRPASVGDIVASVEEVEEQVRDAADVYPAPTKLVLD